VQAVGGHQGRAGGGVAVGEVRRYTARRERKMRKRVVGMNNFGRELGQQNGLQAGVAQSQVGVGAKVPPHVSARIHRQQRPAGFVGQLQAADGYTGGLQLVGQAQRGQLPHYVGSQH